MREIKNTYFKDQDPRRPLLSGLPLPKGEDGVVRDIHFIDCNFHPNCDPKFFVDCKFTNCNGPEDYDWNKY